MKYPVLVLSLLFLWACVPNQPPGVTVHTDEFSPNIEIAGSHNVDDGWTTFYEWQLFSLMDKKTLDVTHALYFDTTYTGQKDPFVHAYDDTSQELTLLNLHTDMGTCYHRECSLTEKAEIVLKDSDLRKRITTGFRIKIISRDGVSYVLPITPAMIKLQLEAVDKYQTRDKTKSQNGL